MVALPGFDSLAGHCPERKEGAMRTVREIRTAEFGNALRVLGTPGWITVRCVNCADKMVWRAEWEETEHAWCEACLGRISR